MIENLKNNFNVKLTKVKIFQMVAAIFVLLFSQFALQDTTFKLPSKILFFVSSVVIILLILFFNDIKNRKSLARNAILLIILIGAAACIVKPPQRGLDEESHLTYTIELADGNLFRYQNDFDPTKSDVNLSQPDWTTLHNFDSIRNQKANTSLSDFIKAKHQSSTYGGSITSLANLSYLPNAIGWDIGKLISNRVFVSYYLGRLFNVLAFALLAFIALKISKKYSEVLFLFATFPTTLWVVAGYSYDYLFYGLSLILIALFINFFEKEKSVGKKESLLFIGLSLLMIFPKFPYVLIGALVCVLPNKYYKSIKERLFAITAFFSSLVIAGIYYINSSIFSKIFHTALNTGNPKVNGGILSLLSHPGVLLRTFFFEVLGSIGAFAGGGQGNPPAPLQYVSNDSSFLHNFSPFLFVLLLILVSVNLKIRIPVKIKQIIIVVFLVIIFMIMYAMAGDSRVGIKNGDIVLHGIQFRYFYLMFLAVPFFVSDKIKMILGSVDKDLSKVDENSVAFLQYSLVFLNIFILGLAMFSFGI